MAVVLFVLLVALLALSLTSAFVRPLPSSALLLRSRVATPLFGCRRNNKDEKRKRNRDYARKFLKTGDSRKKMVIEAKRRIVAESEERFTAELFQFTTDEDMPEYTGFDNI